MHITLESDYAVRIVYCLAQNGGRMEAAAIAELVKSYKGAGGGYELAKAPDEISLYEVIEQVEGPYAISRCLSEEDYTCNRNRQTCGVCKFNRIYAEISETVTRRLEGIKFGDLLD